MRRSFYNEEKWVVVLFSDSPVGYDELYDIDMAKADLKIFRQDCDDVPEDLTAETLMEVWNYLACNSNEKVKHPNGKWVPRYTVMSDRDIAEAIEDAYDWSHVKDLVEYINSEYLHMEVNEYGYLSDNWQDVVEEWCDQQLR